MKSGWATKKLGEVCEILYGFPFESKLFNSDGKGQQVVRIRDVLRGYSETYTTEKCESKYVLSRGDVLIGMDGDFHVASWKVNGALLNQRVCKIDSGSHITNKYLLHALPVDLKKIWDCKLFSTVKHLSAKDLNGIDVVLPPLAEQKRIVTKIDAAFEKIDKLKANAERNLANAKELFQSVLNDAMSPKKGWAERRLGEVGACKNGLNFKRVAVGESIDIVGVGDFKKGLFVDDTTSLERLTLDKLPEQDWYLQPNDIVFVRSNGSKALVGRAVIVKTRRLLTFSGFCIRYRIEDKNVNADFLARIVSSERFRKKMLVGRNASTINNVTQPILLAQVIGLPSLVEQKQIVKRLDSLSEKVKSLEQHYTRQVADCAELRQSVLREAFEGRLKKE